MKPIALKYMFLLLSRSTIAFLVTLLGFVAYVNEPSAGISSLFVKSIGGESCAEPKMKGIKEWSSSPQTP